MHDRTKSLISLFSALLPIFVLCLSQSSNEVLEKYHELLLVASIPGFLYFIRYEVIRPIIREDVVKPLSRVMATCVRALLKQEDAITKLQVLELTDE